jgi:hypothetical protein
VLVDRVLEILGYKAHAAGLSADPNLVLVVEEQRQLLGWLFDHIGSLM